MSLSKTAGMQEYTAFHQKQALALVQSCVQALHAASDADIGVMVPDNASSMEAVNGVSLSQILQLGIDCIAPIMQTPLQTSGVDYTDRLQYLTMMCQGQVRLMPFC